MTASVTRHAISAFAVLALSGSIALTQQPPAPSTPAAPAPPTAPAPPMRRPPMRPGMMQQSMGQRGHGGPQMMHSHFRGGPGGGFHGRPQGGGMSFHVGPEGMWWKNPMVVQRLSLTTDQTKKMDDIFQQSRLQLIDLKANVEKAQIMLEPMLSANPLDVAKASAQIDKVAQARADLEKSNAKMLLGIRAVLTPDQWTKLRDRHFGDGPGAQGGPGPQGGPAPAGAPGGGPGGRSRGMSRGGSQPGSTTNLIDPIDEP